MVEFHPVVHQMMRVAAPDEATLAAWERRHLEMTPEDVDELGELAERDEYLDAVGWDV